MDETSSNDEQEQMTKKDFQMHLRKKKIWDLMMQGFSQELIAKKLNVSTKTVSRDFKEIKKDSVQWMETLPRGQIQIYYRSDFETFDKVNAELWEIFHSTKDEKLKIKILSSISGNKVAHGKMLAQSKLLELGNYLHQKLSPDTGGFKPWDSPKRNEIDLEKL